MTVQLVDASVQKWYAHLRWQLLVSNDQSPLVLIPFADFAELRLMLPIVFRDKLESMHVIDEMIEAEEDIEDKDRTRDEIITMLLGEDVLESFKGNGRKAVRAALISLLSGLQYGDLQEGHEVCNVRLAIRAAKWIIEHDIREVYETRELDYPKKAISINPYAMHEARKILLENARIS